MTDPEVLRLGQPLPPDVSAVFAATGSGGAINLPFQLVTTVLHDFRPGDADVFAGPARFRVGRCETFLLISLALQGLNFDIVWSPLIAKATGEPLAEKPEGQLHPYFHFVLADGNYVIRALRGATISPQCWMAIWRAQSELMQANVQPRALQHEMTALFARYAGTIPDGFFHESCALGD